ncbi:cytochrome c biogenesis CcdA family protein [Boudabousia marimammalium]|uniref:Uncharacterized protein n=1 Tax=Boudabousia marimammalium TaxID=156892 RepID=A0A1Q5PT93_9ACTO|nr:cytochrome c biogenesis CcdA family protein [Boudabousia marimammalium]OKL50600.1 hypothetical protein BM477_01175 [Boudabousia marimammalium]
MSINFAGAYLGGLLTLFAPCAALILPSFFAYAFADRRTLISRTLWFTLGLLISLTPLGFLAGSFGALIQSYGTTLTLIIGALVIVMGVWQALALPGFSQWFKRSGSGGRGGRGRLSTRSAVTQNPQVGLVADVKLGVLRDTETAAANSATNPLAVFGLGVGYGLAGVGCSGPILGAMLALASFGGSPIMGGFLMAFYALGMATPIFLLALLWERFRLGERGWLKPTPIRVLGRATTRGGLISGIIFILLGVVLIITGGHSALPALLSPTTQVQWEQTIASVTNAVPPALFVALFVALIALIWVWRRTVRDREE